jgi:hypothetical protein
MKTSESIIEISKALHSAQAEMGGAKKDTANTFFKSKYADLTSVMVAIKQPFADNGLSFVQCPLMNDQGVGVVTRIMHTSGEWVESELILPLVKLDPQAAGSAISYAKRYSLQSMAGVPSTDDDAEFAMQRQKQPAKLVGDEDHKRIASLIASTGANAEKFNAAFGVNNASELTEAQAVKAIAMLEKKAAK